MIEDDFYPPGSLAGRAMQALRRPETFPARPSWKDVPTPERNVTDPALSLAHADLAAADFGRHLDQLHVLRLPAFVPEPSGALPGTTRGLEYGTFHSGSSFHWFHAAPAEWSALGNWSTAAVEAIENTLVAAGHPRAPEVV